MAMQKNDLKRLIGTLGIIT